MADSFMDVEISKEPEPTAYEGENSNYSTCLVIKFFSALIELVGGPFNKVDNGSASWRGNIPLWLIG